MKKTASTTVLMLLLSLMLVSLPEINIAEANIMPIPTPQPAIIIRSDGSVEPSTAPIQRSGRVYTLTDDIVGYTIAVERDNIALDGGGYTIQGNGNSTGVFIKNRDQVTVRNMEISNFYYGIRLIAEPYMGGSSESNILSGNTVTDNNIGIYIVSSSNNTLENNYVNNNIHGIYLSSSSNNLLRNNQMNNNRYGFFVYASTLSNAINDVDATNKINGKPIIYWINQQNKAVPSDAGFIALVNCTDMTIQNFDLVNNGQGILLVSVTNSTIAKNRIANNGNGIWLVASSNNNISENIITDNSYDSIYVYSSTNNNIIANTITNGGHEGTEIAQVIGSSGRGAICLTGSSNNNIIDNTINNNGEGINLQDSQDNNIDANIITNNNGSAIHLFESSQVNITHNTIKENNGWGIELRFKSSNNTVHSNYIEKNSNGISIDNSGQNKITYNTSTENDGWGIQLESATTDPSLSSSNNIIHHNNFINNKAEGLEVSIPGIWAYPEGWIPGLGNIWDDGKEGNYWGDYITRYSNATEIEDEDTWDIPYYINPNNIDHYPLTTPVDSTTIPEFPSWIVLPIFMIATLLTAIAYKRLTKKLQNSNT